MPKFLYLSVIVLAAAFSFSGCGGGGEDDPDSDPTPTPGDDSSLTNGVSRASMSGASAEQTHYQIVVPAGATGLNIQTSGGTGDVELYVRFGQAPTLTLFDCESIAFGNDETCNFETPSAGTWHIMLYGYTPYSGTTLTASFTAPSGAGGDGDGNGNGDTDPPDNTDPDGATYQFEVNSRSLTIARGQYAWLVVDVNSSVYDGNSYLSVSNASSGITPQLSQSSTFPDGRDEVTTDWASDVRILVDAGAPLGSGSITLRARPDESVAQTYAETFLNIEINVVDAEAASSPEWLSLALTAGKSCGIRADGNTYCWGSRYIGDGIDTHIKRLVPTMVSGAHDFVKLADGGGLLGCGLTATSDTLCWGSNSMGALATGSDQPTFSLVPRQITGSWAFTDIATSGSHGCGIDSGSAYCWGPQWSGQLGDGVAAATNGQFVAEPSPVLGGHVLEKIYATSIRTCGLTESGAAYCWGDNSAGQFGNGTQSSENTTPVAAGGGLLFEKLALGNAATCGLTLQGEVYCWGTYNAVGDGSSSDTNRLSPVAIDSNLTFTDIAAGVRHACALAEGGAAYCWGTRQYGELGNGESGFNLPSSRTPVAVSGGHSFRSIEAATSGSNGISHTCGITPAGKVYCWGGNDAGQLGDNTQINRTTPVPVLTF